jgi:16S rRNA (cytidine1402-2'-O)-methyltransferase
MPGTLFVVATPIGNLEDITLRALRVLGTVAVIAAEDTRRTSILLRRYEISTTTLSFHEHNERDRTVELLRRLQAGESVALVSDAGTPLISDPGARLVKEAIGRGLKVESVPGASAVMAALTVSGLSTERFTFLGFAPGRKGERQRWLQSVRSTPGTLVYFEAPHRIKVSLEAVRDVLGERHIVLARELTKAHESVIRGWVSDVLSNPLEGRGEYTILVSDQIMADVKAQPSLSDAEVVNLFGHLTSNGHISPRDAVAQIASTGAGSRQNVYSVLRRAGKLG